MLQSALFRFLKASAALILAMLDENVAYAHLLAKR